MLSNLRFKTVIFRETGESPHMQQSRKLYPCGPGTTTGKGFYILGIQNLRDMHKTVSFLEEPVVL